MVKAGNVWRKTIKDLVDCLYTVRDKQDMDIYRGLIASYINPTKNIKARLNRAQLRRIRNDENTPYHIRFMIDQSIQLAGISKQKRDYER